MNEQDQRIAIAEACGAEWRVNKSGNRLLVFPQLYNLDGTCDLAKADGTERLAAWDYIWREGCIPNYLHDLNAMHEAEKVLTDAQYTQYENLMWDIIATQSKWQKVGGIMLPAERFRDSSATAAQRAEAFLRTIGKWKD